VDAVAALLAKGAAAAPRNAFGATPLALARGGAVRGWLRCGGARGLPMAARIGKWCRENCLLAGGSATHGRRA
jgi:hypothetical protein